MGKKGYDEPTEFDRYVHHMIWDEMLRQAENVDFCVYKVKRDVVLKIYSDVLDDKEKVKRINEIRGNANCVLCTLSGDNECQFCRSLGLNFDEGRCLGGLYDKVWLGDIEVIKTIRDLI